MALNTDGVWSLGDELRVIECLLLPFSQYTLDCTSNCMNELETISGRAASNVIALLDEYDVAKAAETAGNLTDTEGKVLVKADVLEWEVTGANVPSGAQSEMMRIRMEVANYFAFCSCLGGMLPGGGSGSIGGYGNTNLIRS